MAKLKSIGVLSAGKIFALLYAFGGLIAGAFMTLFTFIGADLSKANAGMFSVLFGAASIILLPIFYGIIGFIGGMIMAALYNLIANKLGGLEIEIK